MEFIHYDITKKFVFGIKANRLIALSEEDKKSGQYQNLNTLPIKDGEKRKVGNLLNGSLFKGTTFRSLLF